MSRKPPTKWELGNSNYVSRYFIVGLVTEVKETQSERETKIEKQTIESNIWIMENSKGENKETAGRKSSIKNLETRFQTRRTRGDSFNRPSTTNKRTPPKHIAVIFHYSGG